MNWITPFAYVDDDGALHVSVQKVLEQTGLPLTEENCAIAVQAIVEQIKEAYPKTQLIILSDPTTKEVSHG